MQSCFRRPSASAEPGAQLAEVVAGAELQTDLLKEVSDKWNLTPYRDYEDMLKQEVLDIVCVLTGPKYSAKVARRTALAHVNVLVEKPMALSVDEAVSLADCCHENRVKLFYGESFRFFPTLRKTKEILDSGELGEFRLILETVLNGVGETGFEAYGIYPDGAPGSGPMGLTDHGIHLVDIFRWFTNSEVSWVFGRGNRAGTPSRTEFMTLGSENGAIAQFVANEATIPSDMPGEGINSSGPYEGGGPAWDPNPINFRIHCSEGALRAFPYANKLYKFSAHGQEQVEVLDCPHPGQFGLQIDSFAKSLVKDGEPEITADDGINALRVILAAYDGLERRCLAEKL